MIILDGVYGITYSVCIVNISKPIPDAIFIKLKKLLLNSELYIRNIIVDING